MSRLHSRISSPATSALLFLLLCSPGAADEITLLGIGSLPGTAVDFSGLTDELGAGLPHNQLSGFSALEYTGTGNRYLALPDRGPGDGAYPYQCRVQVIDIELGTSSSGGVILTPVATTLLRDAQGSSFTGATNAFDAADPARSRRFDPEGLRAGPGGQMWISDEYGPSVLVFDAAGVQRGRLPIPPRYLIAHPAESKDEEAAANQSGRQPNKGMEGVAIVPGGNRLVGVMQGPLIQDSQLKAQGKRTGTNVRILVWDLATLATSEYLYTLDRPQNVLSEILAINDREFLLIERDGSSGEDAGYKRVIRASLDGATEISAIDSLPAQGVPADVQPLTKSVFIDLLDPRFNLAGKTFPEKIEGLTFGPTLADGRRLLLVCVDNDFHSTRPNLIYAFAVDAAALPNFGWKY